MKEVGLLINLYQPPTRDESQIQQFVQNCCFPLIKLLKKNKKIKVFVCIPLSTLELLDKYGYKDVILGLKDLYDADKIQLTSTTAYYSFLIDLSKDMLQKQIILNEYGLGYYFGARQGFEGEASIMIRDLDTFFPPEFETTEEINDVIQELGYKEVFSDKNPIFYIDLSTESVELVEELLEESIFEERRKEIVKCDKSSPVSRKLVEVERLLVDGYMTKDENTNINDFETLAIWVDEDVNKIEDVSIHNKIRSFISLSKFLCLEKYQNSSDQQIIEKYIELLFDFLKYFSDGSVTSEVNSKVEELKNIFT